MSDADILTSDLLTDIDPAIQAAERRNLTRSYLSDLRHEEYRDVYDPAVIEGLERALEVLSRASDEDSIRHDPDIARGSQFEILGNPTIVIWPSPLREELPVYGFEIDKFSVVFSPSHDESRFGPGLDTWLIYHEDGKIGGLAELDLSVRLKFLTDYLEERLAGVTEQSTASVAELTEQSDTPAAELAVTEKAEPEVHAA